MKAKYSDRVLYLNPFSFGIFIFEVVLVTWCIGYSIWLATHGDWGTVPVFLALTGWNAYSLYCSLKMRRKDLEDFYRGSSRRRVKWS